MTHSPEALAGAVEAAERWAIHDPDPLTRGRIDALVDHRDPELVQLFDGRLAFGTAGLRAAVGPGPNRMNALVVRQTTAAVVAWLKEQGTAEPRVVIGFDARHDSERFAVHTHASVVAGGGHALRADGWAPTPVFAHAVLAEDADAGIVITASHNPPDDNGYKLYLGDGLQLVDPADGEIAALIDEMAREWHRHGAAIDDAFADLDGVDDDAVSVDAWIEGHRADALAALLMIDRSASVVYTAMHGVGGAPLLAAFEAAGFAPPIVVPEQFEPDGDFPTVSFPNPEEPGALDLALGLAERHAVDLVIANDPDADRLAVAVPARDGNGYTTLSGNQLGLLLATHVLRFTTGGGRLVARSVVSTRMLDALAEQHGVECHVALTGFKWVARPIVSQPTMRYVFGFEEAIGYCVGDRVRDKDGISAALVAAEMISVLASENRSAWDVLDELAAVHGVHANHPLSLRFDDNPQRVAELMDQFATSPPERLGGSVVTESGPVGLGMLPTTAGVHLLTGDRTQVIVRPSGTEPKLKAYIEVIEPVGPRGVLSAVPAARARAGERLAAVVADVRAALT